MNYLIPNWRQQDADWHNDGTLSVIRLFQENQVDHQIVMLHHMPFLRYKAQEHSILSPRFVRIFDRLQGISLAEGHPLTLNDLALPEAIEEVYYPFGVQLYLEGRLYARGEFNRYGCLESLRYEAGYREVFDDRGFLSMKEFFQEDGQLAGRHYFNEFGEITVKEQLLPEFRVAVIRQQDTRYYDSLQDAVAEVLENYFEDAMAVEVVENVLVVSEPQALSIMSKLSLELPLVQLLTDKLPLTELTEVNHKETLVGSKYVVTETSAKAQEFTRFCESQRLEQVPRLKQIPFFHTDLELGHSNSIGQLILLWKLGPLEQQMRMIHELLMEKLIRNEKYSLLIHADTHLDAHELEQVQKRLVDAEFGIDSESDEYKKVEKFIHAKRSRRLFTTDEEAIVPIRKTELWRPLVNAVAVYDRLAIKVAPSLTELKADLAEARLLLDIRREQDQQLQSLAVSAGVPLLTPHETEFTLSGKNALILQSPEEIEIGLTYFMDDLNNWNKSLVESVQLIETFGAQALMNDWREVLYGTED